MKILFWTGLLVMILGGLSFVIPLPHVQRDALQIGDVSLKVQTQRAETISPLVSGLIMAAGAALMISTRPRAA